MSEIQHKVLIVEGKTDKEHLLHVLREPVEFVCTRGTLSYNELEHLIALLQDRNDVYIFVDADESGMKLRSQLRQELPNAMHLYTRRMYREVATTPADVLAWVLHQAHFQVREHLLIPHKLIGQNDKRPTDELEEDD